MSIFKRFQSSDSGVTLLEVLVALGITSLVITGLTGMSRLGYRAFSGNMADSMKTIHNSSFDYVFNKDLKNATGVIVASANPAPADLANMCTTYTEGSTSVRPFLTAYLQHTLVLNSAEVTGANSSEIKYYTTSSHDLHPGMPITISGLSPNEYNLSTTIASVDSDNYRWFTVAIPSNVTMTSSSTTPAPDLADLTLANGHGVSISYIGYEVISSSTNPNTTEFVRVECETLAADGKQKIVDSIKYRSDMPEIGAWDWSKAISCTPTASTNFSSTGSQPQTCPLDVPIIMGQKSISTTKSIYDPVAQSLLLDNTGNSVSNVAIGASVSWPNMDPSVHALVTSAVISNTGNTSNVKIMCYGSAGPTAASVPCQTPTDPVTFMGAMTVYPTASSAFNPITVNDASRLGVGMYTTDATPLVIKGINVNDLSFWRSPSSLPSSLTFVSCAAITIELPATTSNGKQVLAPFKLTSSRGLS